jgi:hypothetical protein
MDEDVQSPSRADELEESSFQLETLLKVTQGPKQSMRSRFLGGGRDTGKGDRKVSPRGPMLKNAKSPKPPFRTLNRDMEVQNLQLANGGRPED